MKEYPLEIIKAVYEMQANKIKIWEPNDNTNFYNNHITFTSVSFIQELLKYLKNLKINYFTFDRTYTDGSHIKLTTTGEWIKHYYQKKFYNTAIFEQNPNEFSESFIFWRWLKREPIYSEAALFDIDHGLTITQPHKNYCDFFHFGTSKDQSISQQMLISNIHVLYKFIALFKDKAHHLIIDAEKMRFILPIKSQIEISLNEIKKIDKINIADSIQRLYLGDEFSNAYLTKREIEILFYLKKCKQVSDIAVKLGISARTAETHISNIKEKLNCKNLFELGFITRSIGIHDIFTNSFNK